MDDTSTQPSEVMMASIIVDDRFQCRYAISDETIEEYVAAAMDSEQWPFPPIRTVNGWLVDGRHRYEAAKRLGKTSILAIRTEGSTQDALRLALAANANHGLRRSRADLRRTIEMAIAAWPDKSNREIAYLAKTSHPTVAKVRAELNETSGKFTTQQLPATVCATLTRHSAPGDAQIGKFTTQAPINEVLDHDPDISLGDALYCELENLSTCEVQQNELEPPSSIEVEQRSVVSDERNRIDTAPIDCNFPTDLSRSSNADLIKQSQKHLIELNKTLNKYRQLAKPNSRQMKHVINQMTEIDRQLTEWLLLS